MARLVWRYRGGSVFLFLFGVGVGFGGGSRFSLRARASLVLARGVKVAPSDRVAVISRFLRCRRDIAGRLLVVALSTYLRQEKKCLDGQKVGCAPLWLLLQC